jgi:hypothetical protein
VAELAVSARVKAPGGFALAFLNQYIKDQALASGEAQLSLRFPLRRLFGGLVLEREVTVQVDYLPKSRDGVQHLAIHWRPDDTTLFPTFDGRIGAQPDGPQACVLNIAGNYDVPLGVAGVLFDAVVGYRIARGTLEGLLAEFGKLIEDDYLNRING